MVDRIYIGFIKINTAILNYPNIKQEYIFVFFPAERLVATFIVPAHVEAEHFLVQHVYQSAGRGDHDVNASASHKDKVNSVQHVYQSAGRGDHDVNASASHKDTVNSVQHVYQSTGRDTSNNNFD